MASGLQSFDPAAPTSREGNVGLGPVATERAGVVGDISLHYRVFGDVEAARANGWIVVFHALTGSADVDAWWGGLIGPGRPLDTRRHAVVAVNLPGSCYGSTGPREWRAAGRGPFPALTPRDLAAMHEPLFDALGVGRVALATGGSLGGMVALQWGTLASRPIDRLVVLAAPTVTSAQSIAWNAAQRMAIEADPRWRGGAYPPEDPPSAGLAAARAIAMITYRSPREFALRFGRSQAASGDAFSAEAYLRRHGEKLVARFDASAYVTLTEVMDRHDVGPIAVAAEATATRAATVVGVGVDTDILYPVAEIRAWVDEYRALGVQAVYREITSVCGHDAFLIELDQVGAILTGA
jgi:homoserine O-acetyltransferase/O-succinyltransferase